MVAYRLGSNLLVIDDFGSKVNVIITRNGSKKDGENTKINVIDGISKCRFILFCLSWLL